MDDATKGCVAFDETFVVLLARLRGFAPGKCDFGPGQAWYPFDIAILF
jgi:hypothetical protein